MSKITVFHNGTQTYSIQRRAIILFVDLPALHHETNNLVLFHWEWAVTIRKLNAILHLPVFLHGEGDHLP